LPELEVYSVFAWPPAAMIAERSDELSEFSLYGVITVTLAPFLAALSSALVMLLERSQALMQMVFAFGMMVVKKVESTLVCAAGWLGAGVWRQAVSSKSPEGTGEGLYVGTADGDADGFADADGEADGLAVGEGEGDAFADGEGDGDAATDGDGDGDAPLTATSST